MEHLQECDILHQDQNPALNVTPVALFLNIVLCEEIKRFFCMSHFK